MKVVILFLTTALLWLPYYVWGVGLGNEWLRENKIVPAILVVSITVLVGFTGLHFLQRFLTPDIALSNANFRIVLILSTQLTAVLLIAIDSNFNWMAILAGLLVVCGAIVGTVAIR